MSTTIDSKVVEMRFDNRQFEQGVNQSISTLDKLKSSLSPSGGLDSNLSNISSGVGTISNSFTAMGVIARRILENIADKAFFTGQRLFNSLGLQNIISGWQKYAEITSSTQTIMAATKKDWKDQGKQMEYVNGQLEKLNWFTDETSYSLTDMTSNIGKFTSAGVKLDQATDAMMGVASWAAISGSNTQQASRAMYNLSQAMGMGALRVQDWMSIENANMATKEFKDTAIKTAHELGVLKKSADGVYYTVGKGNKLIKVTSENFRSTLSTGWLNSKVLTKVLKKYGDFANDLYKYTDKTDLSATQLLKATDAVKKGVLDLKDTESIGKYIEDNHLDVEIDDLSEALGKLSNKYNDLGFNAFKAAQEAKTFKEAMDYTKDALSTQWMNTFKTIFGDYQQAKELWTGLTEEFYDLFVEDIENQNAVLKKWAKMGGRDQLLWAIKHLWTSVKEVINTVKDTFRDVFPPVTASQLFGFVSKFNVAMSNLEKNIKPLCQRIRYILTPAFEGMKNIISSLINVVKAVGRAFKNIFSTSDLNILEYIAEIFNNLTKVFKVTEERGKKLQRLFEGLFAVFDIIKMAIVAILQPLVDLTGETDHMADGLFDVAAMFGDWLKSIRDWLKEHKTFQHAMKVIVGFFKDLPGYADKAAVALTGMHLSEIFDKIKNAVKNAWTYIKGVFARIKEDLAALFGQGKKAQDGVEQGAKKTSKSVGGLADQFDKLKKVFAAIKPYLDQISKFFKENVKFEWPSMEQMGDAFVKGGIFAVFVSIAGFIKTIKNFFKGLMGDKDKIVSSITGMFNSITKTFNTLQDNIKAKTLKTIATAILEIAAAIFILALLPEDKLMMATFAVGAMMAELAFAFGLISRTRTSKDKLKQIQGMLVIVELILGTLIGGIYLLASNVKIEDATIAAGLIAILLGSVAGFVAIMSKIKITKAQGEHLQKTLFLVSILISKISVALMIAAQAGDWKTLLAAGAAMSGMLFAIAGAMKIMPRDKQMKSAAAAMLIVSSAILVMAVAIAIMGRVPAEGMLGALAALGGLLLVITASLMVLGKSEGNILKAAAAMVIVAAGITLLAFALAVMSKVVETGNMAQTLLLLAASLAAVLVAGAVAQYISMGLLALGAAIALIGVGALAAGTGLYMFASGLEKLVAIGPDGVLALMGALTNFFMLLPMMATKIAESFVNMIKVFTEAKDVILKGVVAFFTVILDAIIQIVPKLTQTISTVIVAILNMLITIIPKFMEFLGVLVVEICKFIIANAPIITDAIIKLTVEGLRGLRTIIPEITSTLFAILVDTLRQIRDNIEEIVQLATEIGILVITGCIKGITEQIPNMVETGWNFVLALINGIADGVDKHAKELHDAILKLANALINGFCTIMGIKSPSKVFDSFGINIVQGLINGITGMAKKAWDAITGLATELIDKFKEGFKDIKDKASEIIGGKDGVVERITGFVGKMKDIGSNLINALKKGMEKAKDKLITSATTVGDVIIGAIKKVFHIKSPSRVFMEIGRYLDEGLAIGMEDYAYEAVDATENVANSITDTISSIADMVNSDIDAEPTIKPVLDLSNITDGVNQMDGMLSANRTINLAASSSGSINNRVTAQQEMAMAFESLKATLSDLASEGGTVNNNTFNITGDDPKAIADEVSRILNNKVERRDAAWAL